ncbi:hypothetical protein ACIP5Y_43420 [Nocardia sp. NPDC088792]|uniref:DUF7373 family lipoprotein n=1 Tax=Nocardia sp. NPDC088792 TaxID=3364332 RepID=UPI0038135A2D
MRHHTGRLPSARFGLRATAAAILLFSALAATGCGSDSHSPGDQPVDLSKLDTGNYQTKPQDFVPKDAATAARTAEALRLGDIMPLPMEIDPALTNHAFGEHVLLTGDSYDGWVDSDHFGTDAPGYVTGFATAAETTPVSGMYSLSDTVMIFDSDADATNAAGALARSGLDLKSLQTGDPSATAQSPQSTLHPSAQIRWSPEEQALASWYPTGRFIIFTLIHRGENAYLQDYWHIAADPAPLALADKAIDLTADRLKSFQATPPDKLAGLPLDPDGMLRLTLPRPDGDQTANAFTGTLDGHGALHAEDDPNVAPALFEKAGIDRVSYGAGQLNRARDADSARAYLDAAFIDRFRHPIAPPPGLPNATCTQYRGPDPHRFPFDCHVVVGRYVASVWSQQQQDVYQRISAQYAILANGK